MKKHLLAAAALTALAAAPQAQAQLLSGSGLGQVTGNTGSITQSATGTLRSTTRGTLRGETRTRGSQNVDRRSGEVSLDRSLDTGVTATADQLLTTPHGEAAGSAAGSGRASGSGSAQAQLVGTDTVGALAGQGVAQTRSGAAQVRQLATPAVHRAQTAASSTASQANGLTASGSGNGMAGGAGAASLPQGMLVAAGSGAAAGEGAIAIAPGMPVTTALGAPAGKVRQLVSDSRGRVEQVVVESKGRAFTVPASRFAASGNALVMGEGAVSGGKAQPEGAAPEEAPARPAEGETHR